MQRLSLFIVFLFTISYGFTQFSKGKVILGISTNLNPGIKNSDMFQVGYNSTTLEVETGMFEYQDIKIETVGLNFTPKIGYCLIDNTIVGADLILLYGKTLKNDFGYTEKQSYSGVNPFVRRIIITASTYSFFIELAGGLGKAKIEATNIETTESIIYNAGLSPGVSFRVGDRVLFDLKLSYDYVVERSLEKFLGKQLKSETHNIGLELGIVALIGK